MSEHVLDVRGLACPIPALRARSALAGLSPGDVLVVLATDPEAPVDVGALAVRGGHGFRADGERLEIAVRTFENPHTGERATFVRSDPDLVVVEALWPRPGHRAIPHVHPEMEETWTVLEGRAAFRIGTEEREAGPGETVVAPAGVLHEAWNTTDRPVRVRMELRPGLRWEAFVRRLWAGGEDPRALLAEFRREIVIPA